MIILIFGISNVGKTVTGEKLAEKLGYTFIDLDAEVKKRLRTTIDEFISDHPYHADRCKIRGQILRDLINEHKDNTVIAVTPMFYARYFSKLLDLEEVMAVELRDTEENIFDRLIFADAQDKIYNDDAYKMKHKAHYINEIHEDIVAARKSFKKVENKYFIDNKPISQVVDDLMKLIQSVFEESKKESLPEN